MSSYIARSTIDGFNLFCDGFVFGTLSQKSKYQFIFKSKDEELVDWINEKIYSCLSLETTLAKVKEVHEIHLANIRAEHEAEMHSENAWYQQREYDAESQIDLELHDHLHPNGYC